MDIISKLPIGIIETILCLLPIQEAARTSILSREWRYRWTKIPKLVFVENQFQVSTDKAQLSVVEQMFDKPSKRKEMGKRCKLFYAIYQILLMHQGPIDEFILSMEADDSCVEIDHIILHLSRKNTVKKLSLNLKWTFMLPLSLFSLHQLTNLCLSGCALDHQLSFNGFGSLTTLYLHEIWTSNKALLQLLSGCPSLKRLTLCSTGTGISVSGDFTIADFFECLPIIEHLSIWFPIVLCFRPNRSPKELPTTLIHLKCVTLCGLCFSHKYGLPFLALLIRSSPNLEKLSLLLFDESYLDQHEMGSFTLKDYSDITLEHLSELDIVTFSNEANELDFVKLILAKSPVLKKAMIILSNKLGKDDELQISKILSSFPYASPEVKVTVKWSKFN